MIKTAPDALKQQLHVNEKNPVQIIGKVVVLKRKL